jgi:hypothetical protein
MPKAPTKLSTRKFNNFITDSLLKVSLAAAVIGSTIARDGPRPTVVSDREEVPDPAREALDKPHLDAEELEREIGDSEEWDEASDDDGKEEP